MSQMRIEWPLRGLSREEARARLGVLGEYFTSKHGIAVTWNGDRAQVRGKYLVVNIEGTFTFEGEKALFEGKDPGFLWRGRAKEYIERKLAAYLDPAVKLEDLPGR